MGHAYAGVLGLIAFVTVMVQGLGHGAAVGATVLSAVLAMFMLGAIGAVIGQLAGWTVDQSVRARLADEIAAMNKPEMAATAPGTIKKK